MRNLKILLSRDMRNSMNLRVFMVLAVILLMQLFFDFAGGLPAGQLSSQIMFYPLFMFGPFIAIVITFDMISRDRECKVMDFILTSPVSKKSIAASKIITVFILMTAFSIIYTGFGTIMGFAISKEVIISDSLRSLWAMETLLVIYGLWGLLCSIIFRESKISLFTAVAVSLVLKPQLMNAIADEAGRIFGIAEDFLTKALMILPEGIMYSILNPANQHADFTWAMIFLAFHLLFLSFLAFYIFGRQEELNYET